MNYSEWHHIAQQAGLASIEQARLIKTSAFSDCWQLSSSEGKHYWARTCLARHHALIECEVENINALNQAKVCSQTGIIQGKTSKTAWLICDWQTLSSSIDKPLQQLVDSLQLLHQTCLPRHAYGWAHANDINGLIQPNQWLNDWASFYRSQRLLPQLIKAKENGLAQRFIDQIEAKLANHYESCFEQHHPQPCLLHGNLYQSPIACLDDARLFFFHPACYYGDAEVDIAALLLSLELHSTRSGANTKDDQPIVRLSAETQARLPWYQLYYLLVEFNLMTHRDTRLIELLLNRI